MDTQNFPDDDLSVVIPAAAPRPALPTARLTVVENVYFQSTGDPPHQHDSRYYAHLPSDEQVYTRRLNVGRDWSPLDLGWVKNCYCLLLSNEEGGRRWTVPTEAEKADLAARVVEVAVVYREGVGTPRTMHDPPAVTVAIPCWLVRPGESCRLSPVVGAAYVVRSRTATARCVVVAFPGAEGTGG